MRVKEESEKAGLKLSIQKTKIIVSSPTTSCQIEGGKVEAATYLIFLGSQITVESEIKRHLLLGRKAMINLDSILKSKDIDKQSSVVKALVFPVDMYGYELDH